MVSEAEAMSQIQVFTYDEEGRKRVYKLWKYELSFFVECLGEAYQQVADKPSFYIEDGDTVTRLEI